MRYYGIIEMCEGSEGWMEYVGPNTIELFTTKEERHENLCEKAKRDNFSADIIPEDGDFEYEYNEVREGPKGKKYTYETRKGYDLFEIDLPILFLDRNEVPRSSSLENDGPVEVVSLFD